MSDFFKGLSDPTRRAILDLLAIAPLNINQMAEHFAHLSRPAISQHLTVLEESGLIKIYKTGRERYGCLNSKAFLDLHNWLAKYLALSVTPGDGGLLVNPENLAPSAELTQPVMLQAMLARDERFKGRFYAAVKTTRIFCHLTCSASPKPENVLFFRTKEDAINQGFRACKRCKP